MKRPDRRDYNYLTASFGNACYRADLAVWQKKHRRPEPVAPVPEPEPSAFADSRDYFDRQAKAFPDLLERYVIVLADVETEDEQQKIMWRGLRETFRQRYGTRKEQP